MTWVKQVKTNVFSTKIFFYVLVDYKTIINQERSEYEGLGIARLVVVVQ